jgi:hypothetical protein
MENGKEKIMERIRKLLALSNNPNEHEAAAAAAKAQSLLAEYNLSLAEVVIDKKKDAGFVADGSILTAPYPWRRQLAAAVARLYFCEYYYTTVGPKNNAKNAHYFVGQPHNIDVAKMMFVYLEQTVDRLAKEGAQNLPRSEQSPYRTTFRNTCTNRLRIRIMERIKEAMEGKVKSETTGKALLLVDVYQSNQRALTAHLAQTVPGLRAKASKIAIIHGKGALDGDTAGRSIGLDTQVAGRSSKPSGLLK